MQRTLDLPHTVDQLSGALGSGLATVFGALAQWRGAKALHPRGTVLGGRLVALEHRPTGVAWVDGLVDTPVVARLSRSAGLPAPLPDVLGLALRVPLGEDGFGDLLLSTGAQSRVLRHLFVPRRDPSEATYTSMLPFATPVGWRMVGALPHGGATFTLALAEASTAWTPFADLVLDAVPSDAEAGQDETIDFDPVAHQLPGLAIPAALGRLRQPSYVASRERRPAT